MGAIRSLCGTGMVLDEGRCAGRVSVSDAIRCYHARLGLQQGQETQANRGFFGRVRLLGAEGNALPQDRPVCLSVEINQRPFPPSFWLYLLIEDAEGRNLVCLRKRREEVKMLSPEVRTVSVSLPPMWLNPGLYAVHFKILIHGVGTQTRFVSDKYPLDVVGESSKIKSVLHPHSTWELTP
jgi:lipopolysaccharide transport system ATP-binding protein